MNLVYITKIDVSEDIVKGDKVEIIPDYSYVMGTFTRVKEYFNLAPGQVLIKKLDDVENNIDKKWFFAITKRKNLEEEEKAEI